MRETQQALNEQWRKDVFYYLREHGRNYFQMLSALVCRYGRYLLDVGCGEALILEHLPEEIDYVGIDLSDYIIGKNIRKWYSKTRCFKVDDFFDPTTPGKYDVVLMAGTLHTVPRLGRAAFVNRYIEQYEPRVVILAHTRNVDTADIEREHPVLASYVMKVFFVPAATPLGDPETLNTRRIIVIEGWKGDRRSEAEPEAAADIRSNQA